MPAAIVYVFNSAHPGLLNLEVGGTSPLREEVMLGHIILLFAEKLSEGNQSYRSPLKYEIPAMRELIDNPAHFLDGNEVRLKPGNRHLYAFLLGLSLGLFVALTVRHFIVEDQPNLKEPPLEERMGITLFLVGTPVMAIGGFLYLFRGGEIILQRHGVEIRFRRRVVVCPWSLFHTRGEPEWLDTWTLAIPVNPDAIPHVKLIENGDEIESGRDISVKQFRFRPDSKPRITNRFNLPEIALMDLYRSKLAEIGGLLLVLGSKLG